MDSSLARQADIFQSLHRIKINFSKDSESRKTLQYLQNRLKTIQNLWQEFDQNHTEILDSATDQDREHQYFKEEIYDNTKQVYQSIYQAIYSHNLMQRSEGSSADRRDQMIQTSGKLDDFLANQRANFRAFKRLLGSIDISQLSERWEIQDEINNLQIRWKTIDKLHLEIDSILDGADVFYEDEFYKIEASYKSIKRELNQLLSASAHTVESTPKLQIPVFFGDYTLWPTFYDLFSETIHNNNTITKAQKMQHLKGKLRGEPERLIQHLHISADNYDTAWDILTRRYNNTQVLFTKQIEIFLNQPTISKPTAFELKKLHDTSIECIHAIHNLGVNTQTWDPLIVHLLSRKLDSETYVDYKEARKAPRELPTFEEFIQFLENKFTALEPINRREKTSSFNSTSSSKLGNQSISKPSYQYQPKTQYNKAYNYRHMPNKTHQNQALATYTRQCPLCNLGHDLYFCSDFNRMSPDKKLSTISKHSICPNCLYKHYGKPCFSTKRCKECNGEHNSLIHDAFSNKSVNSTSRPSTPPPSARWSTYPQPSTSSSSQVTPSSSIYNKKQYNVNYVAADDEESLLTTILLKLKSSDGTYITFRALLDQCAQVSLISENAVQMLGLSRRKFHTAISGTGKGPRFSQGIVNVACQSIYDDYQFDTEALVVSRVIGNLPNESFHKKHWDHLQNINLADPEYNISRPIDLLLDTTVYSEVIMQGLIKGPPHAPMAQQTKIGWILSGTVKTYHCHVLIKEIPDLAKYWELEDIKSDSSSMTSGEEFCEQLYQSTTKRLKDGRYEVALPMKKDYEKQLGNSKTKAVAQFRQLERKMSANPEFSNQYKQFMQEYQDQNHMRRATMAVPLVFLPHHGVYKSESTTTKLRVVFNASAKTTSGHSLNDLMENGPNLQKDLPSLILKWRQYKYVVTGDIQRMFNQIKVREDDQHLQSIIWRDSSEKMLQEYFLTTVTFGTKAAPYLAMRTLLQLARDDREKYPMAADALETSCYMDDVLCGEETLDKSKELINQLINILQGAGMNLRKFSSNEPALIKDLPSNKLNDPHEFKCSESRKTLGLKWTPISDTFSYNYNIDHHDNNHLSKRILLSNISKIFDPLGWISPITVRAKLLFQQIWASEVTWDEELSSDIKEKWANIQTDIDQLHKLSISRYIGSIKNKYQLHGFCDSSEKVYACAIYIVTCDKGVYTSSLLAAKTKLSPLGKTVSLARLELCGALLLSQLMKKVMKSLESKVEVEMYAWTDSMIVLGWLHGDSTRWKQFVSNRVQKIIDVIPPACWHHVRSEENSADCATRGKTTLQLMNHSLWWEGPEWLLKFNPNVLPKPEIQKPNIEIKNASVNAALQPHKNNISFIYELLLNSSSLTRVVRAIAWISRFISRLRNKQQSYGKSLTPLEINRAYQLIIKDVQKHDFHLMNKDKRLANLYPFIDEDGILRVGGRLKNANIRESAKHPIILSNHSRFTDLLIQQAHLATLHGGPRLTLSHIRDKYWIISGIRTVKRQLRTCVRCRRFSIDNRHQLMADLPKARVNPSRPFTYTATDFTGFFEVKTNKGRGVRCTKGYVAVFVCLSTKAVHLELVSDLTSASFLAAFRRFCARRGTPKCMYSDNGTNFIGANRLLKQEYREIIQTINEDFFRNIGELDIDWRFNVATWASAGGLWEAVVKSFKYHFKRVVGEQRLTYEEFTTLLHQIEACLNSRPLCPLTEDPDDEVLTSGHFLIGGPLISRPQTEPSSLTLTSRWQLIQAMNKDFWKRWSSEYLQQLQTRSKWITPTPNFKINDIVLLKEDNLPPGKWALGRVLELHPGSDGHVRVVSVKTSSNILKRPIIKLVLLPVQERPDDLSNPHCQSSPPENTSPEAPTNETGPRTRRAKKKVSFSNLLCMALFLFVTLISPTYQQENQLSYHIDHFKNNQSIYFDKISDIQYIRDDWKLIIFYNMSSYWQGVSDLEYYVKRASESCYGTGSQYKGIALQLEHELKEIEHYNTLLRNQSRSRRKRGLINGVGMIANTLFGVLDERFAMQYQQDIEKISQNENHLQNLIRNQTSIVETEYKVLRDNEGIMNQQFKLIKQHIRSLSSENNQARQENQQGLNVLSSLLSTQIIISNIRRIQQTLIQTVTDISHGHIDTLMLPPDELQQQLIIISAQLKGDVTLPVEKSNLMDFYKIIKVFARVTEKYLIIEATIPLISSEVFQLDKIISIPHTSVDEAHYIISTASYISFNLKKDLFVLHSDADLQNCIHLPPKTLFSLNKPLYNLKENQSLCDSTIINIETIGSHCKSYQVACADRWIKLQRHNVWLFSCCQECNVRIFCNSELKREQLRGNGLMTLGQGCVLKGSDLTIYSHNNFISNMSKQNDYFAPKVSILNSIVSTSLSPNFTEQLSNHDQAFHQLKSQIDTIKEQSIVHFSIHDIHHYVTSYIIISILLAIGAIIIFLKIRKSRRARAAAAAPRPQARPSLEQETTSNSVSEVHEMCNVPSELRQSVISVDKSTSPIVSRQSVQFNVPSE